MQICQAISIQKIKNSRCIMQVSLCRHPSKIIIFTFYESSIMRIHKNINNRNLWAIFSKTYFAMLLSSNYFSILETANYKIYFQYNLYILAIKCKALCITSP